MLAAQRRLTRAGEFAAVTRRGRRAGRTRVVVHLGRDGVGSTANRRAGLVVSKKVGNAVVRHRVSRRLRHILAPLLPGLPPGTDLVVRALPAAGSATYAELAIDVGSALRTLSAGAGTR